MSAAKEASRHTFHTPGSSPVENLLDQNKRYPAGTLREPSVQLMMNSLGGEAVEVLSRGDVNEIYVNPGRAGEPLEIWSDGRGGKEPTGVYLREEGVRQFLNAVATTRGEEITADKPHIQAQLPYGDPFHGARLQGIIPPVTSQATLVIRKHSKDVFTLDSYVEYGTMSPAQRQALADAVRNHENIVVAGGTGSGKTTLTNAVLLEVHALTPDDRIVLLEDTPELQCQAEDYLAMRTSPEVSMKKLVYLTLRCTPNRIVVGEVRDDAAYDLLDAWATGHPGGVCTVHAETPQGALARLHRLAGKGEPSARHELIAESVGVVVIVERRGQTRRIAQFVRVKGWTQEGGYEIEDVLGPEPPPTAPDREAAHRTNTGTQGANSQPSLAHAD
jgi:type IV secretion system protein VirB11